MPLLSVKCRWNDDWNATERIKRKQIGVPGNDYIRPPNGGQFQKFIVVRIAARAQITNDRHEFGSMHQLSQMLDER
jgi:hypothetical protein